MAFALKKKGLRLFIASDEMRETGLGKGGPANGSPLFPLPDANPIPGPLPQRAREGELRTARGKILCVGRLRAARMSTSFRFILEIPLMTAAVIIAK